MKQTSSFYFRERYQNLAFLFIGRDPKYVEFHGKRQNLDFKPFGTVSRKSESISIETNIFLIFSRKI